MRNTQTTAHLPRAYSTSHAQKALNRIRVYVRFRAHVTVFCLRDGESRSAFDGPKPLIARRCQRDSAYGPCDQKINSAPTTEGRRFGAVPCGLLASQHHSTTASFPNKKLRRLWHRSFPYLLTSPSGRAESGVYLLCTWDTLPVYRFLHQDAGAVPCGHQSPLCRRCGLRGGRHQRERRLRP